jgi:hypothetical protein
VIDGAALDRILSAAFGHIPTITHEQRNELVVRLNRIASDHRIGKTLRSKQSVRQKRAKKIVSLTEDLIKLVDDHFKG